MLQSQLRKYLFYIGIIKFSRFLFVAAVYYALITYLKSFSETIVSWNFLTTATIILAFAYVILEFYEYFTLSASAQLAEHFESLSAHTSFLYTADIDESPTGKQSPQMKKRAR